MERTVLVFDKDVLQSQDFLMQMQASPNRKAAESLPPVGTMTLEQIEAKMIVKALKVYKNNISHAARSLGLSRGALYRRIEKYDIPYETPN